MEIKYNKDFSKFGEVSTIGDDTIVIKKYSIEDDKPTIKISQNNSFYDKDVASIFINAIAPKKRDLIFLFSVRRTSSNIYKTFIYLPTFTDYNTFSSMKAVVEYLENFFKIYRK